MAFGAWLQRGTSTRFPLGLKAHTPQEKAPIFRRALIRERCGSTRSLFLKSRAALFRPGRRAQPILVPPHLLSPKWPFEELFESRTVLPWVSQPSQAPKRLVSIRHEWVNSLRRSTYSSSSNSPSEEFSSLSSLRFTIREK